MKARAGLFIRLARHLSIGGMKEGGMLRDLWRFTADDPKPGHPAYLTLAERVADWQRIKARLRAALVLWLVSTAALASGHHSYQRPAWRDDDYNGHNTRVDMILKSCGPVVMSRSAHDVVEQATCPDLYTGTEFATDTPAQSIQIDHLFPVSQARARKGWWTEETFADFYNDPGNLVVCRARTNERKGDLMPDGWCPGEPSVRPEVARRFLEVVGIWDLPLTAAEWAGVRAWERGECAPGAKVIE